MDYKILSSSNKTGLTEVVQEHLNNHWTLQGGISMAVRTDNDIIFAQAMIKV